MDCWWNLEIAIFVVHTPHVRVDKVKMRGRVNRRFVCDGVSPHQGLI